MYINIILTEKLCKTQTHIQTEDKAVSKFGALGKYMFMLLRNMERKSQQESWGPRFLKAITHISQSDHDIPPITFCI